MFEGARIAHARQTYGSRALLGPDPFIDAGSTWTCWTRQFAVVPGSGSSSAARGDFWKSTEPSGSSAGTMINLMSVSSTCTADISNAYAFASGRFVELYSSEVSTSPL